jgi:hypothetical protein
VILEDFFVVDAKFVMCLHGNLFMAKTLC